MRTLLGRGLSFVPTQKSRCTQQELVKDLDNFKKRCIDKWMIELPNRARRILQKSIQSIEYDLQNCTCIPPIPNLSKQERMALRLLKKNDNVIISKANKGDSVVILPTTKYVELAHKHLNDRETYQLLSEDPTQEVCQQFVQYLNTCKEKGVITAKQFDESKPPQNVETQTMYFLPKVHKKPLKLRPIVACTGGPTQTASAYIDRLLQPYMKEVRSYISNSIDLIHILQN